MECLEYDTYVFHTAVYLFVFEMVYMYKCLYQV